jgi:PAS domain S-box-containing protein
MAASYLIAHVKSIPEMISVNNLKQTGGIEEFYADIKSKSDKAINYFLFSFFLVGILLARFYDTSTVAIAVGGLSLLAYYSTKILLPDSDLYQYVLSAVFGIFMAQYIYEMHGLFEMHFLAFIGSAMLITYQNWKLQIPLAIVVIIHHALFAYMQYVGYDKIYFTQLDYMSLQTFIIHILLAVVIFFICGLWAYQFKANSRSHIEQSYQIGKLQEEQLKEKAILQSEANLRTIFDNTDTGYILLDKNLNIAAYNQIAYDSSKPQLGTHLKTGENFISILPEKARQGANAVIQMVLTGEPTAHETEYIGNEGSITWYDVRMHCIKDKDQNILGICIASFDITARKMAEGEIRILNESLEEKVQERTSQLEAVNKELEAFCYSVSHDLRAPLRIINGFGKMVLTKESQNITPKVKETLEIMMKNAAQMGMLIDDLLDFSRLGRAELTVKTIDMNELVKTVIEEMQTDNLSIIPEFRLEELNNAKCDPILMKQVWTNLISNAVKYSRKKEQPVIEIGISHINGSVTYFVKDNGAGFDMKFSDKLFAVFQRLHKVTEYEGTGVGLALVERIITKHKGNIWADAKLDEGATFYFTLPNN